MHTNVDQRATAGTFLVGKPETNSSGNSARTDPSGSRAINLAQTTFHDDVASSANGRSEAKLTSKKIDQPTLGRFVSQHLHLGSVHPWRFFAKHMLASFQRSQ